MRRLHFLACAALVVNACGTASPDSAERSAARVHSMADLAADTLTRVDGAVVLIGGYSGLDFDPNGELWTLTDRGPNVDASARAGRPAKRFPLPQYKPHAARLSFAGSSVVVERKLPFRTPGGLPAEGLPAPTRSAELRTEDAYGRDFEALAPASEGIDSEAIAFGAGSVWIGDEYRPSIWRLDTASGELLERYTPVPAAESDRPLPDYLLQRQPNLGFEGLAFVDGYLYAALQGPLSPPGGDDSTPLVRILRLDPASGRTRAFVYVLDGTQRKIGDLAVSPNGKLLVLEHGIRAGRGWTAEVYAIDLGRVDYLNADGLPPERFRDAATALANSVLVAPKELYVDLIAAGYPLKNTKPEGLAVANDGTMYVINDNDFGIDSPSADGVVQATGIASQLLTIK